MAHTFPCGSHIPPLLTDGMLCYVGVCEVDIVAFLCFSRPHVNLRYIVKFDYEKAALKETLNKSPFLTYDFFLLSIYYGLVQFIMNLAVNIYLTQGGPNGRAYFRRQWTKTKLLVPLDGGSP